MSEKTPDDEIVQVSSKKFLVGCLLLAVGIFILGKFVALPASLVAIEVFLAIISLFILGSMKYRVDKNAITYGAVLIIFATFWSVWWEGSALRQRVAVEGSAAWGELFQRYLLTMHGWNELIHAETMLFILGLTFFVAAIAQTRLLESVSFMVLRRNKGWVVPTIAALTGIVSVASGILDGVSMIGLMIRVLVLILFLAKVQDEAVVYAVMVSTIVTTVCGMWLAYGEPPNLIMKANLHPHLDNSFFLRYCAPVAIGSYLLVFFNVRKRLKGKKIDIKGMDILDLHTADVRFFQARQHGEVLLAAEFVDAHQEKLGSHYKPVEHRLHEGESLGAAMIREGVPPEVRKKILGLYVDESLAEDLDQHYLYETENDHHGRDQAAGKIRGMLREMKRQRSKAQKIGFLAFIPFVGFLIWHAIDHDVPLFLASFSGFIVAFLGIIAFPNTRGLALREAKHEFSEYLFLLPLFFSITLLQKTGFFEIVADLIHHGMEKLGIVAMAYLQFTGAAFLSATLDNNVVADFAGRAIRGFELSALHLFAMAQIAGYAVGGCWTHIGSAQSVVSYAFIRREVDPKYTPFQWIKAMTPIILEIFLLMTLIIVAESLLLKWWPDR
ncbi:MAG TPA: SLC13 family permease [bacterium]|nr:SLC13 family permease [bacterium]